MQIVGYAFCSESVKFYVIKGHKTITVLLYYNNYTVFQKRDPDIMDCNFKKD